MAADKKTPDLAVLPIEQVAMPSEDVSDLRDVVDAINKLCETMKTSYDDYEDSSDVLVQDAACDLVGPAEVVGSSVQTDIAETWSEPPVDETACEPAPEMYYSASTDGPGAADKWSDPVEEDEAVPAERTVASGEQTFETYYTASSEIRRRTETETHLAERWSEPSAEVEPAAPGEPTSEMYYTASSEVSLLSDTDLIEKAQNDDSDREKDERSIMAGHVAAMRERFESMTRANTPCPELVRSLSPSLDVFRNITPSPDFLDKS